RVIRLGVDLDRQVLRALGQRAGGVDDAARGVLLLVDHARDALRLLLRRARRLPDLAQRVARAERDLEALVDRLDPRGHGVHGALALVLDAADLLGDLLGRRRGA